MFDVLNINEIYLTNKLITLINNNDMLFYAAIFTCKFSDYSLDRAIRAAISNKNAEFLLVLGRKSIDNYKQLIYETYNITEITRDDIRRLYQNGSDTRWEAVLFGRISNMHEFNTTRNQFVALHYFSILWGKNEHIIDKTLDYFYHKERNMYVYEKICDCSNRTSVKNPLSYKQCDIVFDFR